MLNYFFFLGFDFLTGVLLIGDLPGELERECVGEVDRDLDVAGDLGGDRTSNKLTHFGKL